MSYTDNVVRLWPAAPQKVKNAAVEESKQYAAAGAVQGAIITMRALGMTEQEIGAA